MNAVKKNSEYPAYVKDVKTELSQEYNMDDIKKPEKIHIDTLIEKATEWWDSYPQVLDQHEIIVKAYMEAHNIKDDEVEW